MNRFLGFAAMLALVSVPAFAAKNSQTISISEPVTIGSTQLPPADYRVTWTGTGPAVQVTIAHDKSVVTVPARLVDQKNEQTSIQTKNTDGANVLEGINFSKVSLVFTSSPNSGQ